MKLTTMMLSRSGLLSAGILVFVLASSLAASTISYPNFSSTAGLVFNAAGTVIDPHVVSNKLQITSQGENDRTSIWFNTQVFINNGFTTTIQFQSTSTDNFGNTWDFVIQNDPNRTETIGVNGAIGGITNSIAVESAYLNPAYYIASCGTAFNQSPQLNPSCDLMNVVNQAGHDGVVHSMVITYTANTHMFRVNVDSGTEVISAVLPSDLGSYLGLNGGSAFVGFTGSNGFFTGNSDILSWTLTANDPGPAVPEPVSIALTGAGLVALLALKKVGLLNRASRQHTH